MIVNLIFALIGFNNNNVEIELSLFYLKSNSFIIAYFSLMARSSWVNACSSINLGAAILIR